MRILSSFSLAMCIAFIAHVPRALAQVGLNIPGAIDFVAPGSLESTGAIAGFEFGLIFEYIGTSFIPFLNVTAVLVIIIAGMLAIVAQDENRISSARKVVVSALVAIVLVNLAGALANAYLDAFGGGGGTGIVTTEVNAFLSWIEAPLAIIAVLVIIISGIKAMIDYNGEQGISQFRKTFISVVFGIVLIVVKSFVAESVVTTKNPDNIVKIVVNLITVIVSYMALAAVAVLVIAGLYMILNTGNEEQFRKGKVLVVRVVIGLIVIGLSVALVNIILDAFV